jgi:hypothetical protein
MMLRLTAALATMAGFVTWQPTEGWAAIACSPSTANDEMVWNAPDQLTAGTTHVHAGNVRYLALRNKSGVIPVLSRLWVGYLAYGSP